MTDVQRICLNMIVKNEAHVIERCLLSVKSLITDWCIIDTGSTDGTQEIIKRVMADTPGTLHERAWINQPTNRNEALDLAYATRADYVFLIDADEEMIGDGVLPQLSLDYYSFNVQMHNVAFSRAMLLGTAHRWRWVSVGKRCQFHPYLHSETAKTEGRISTWINHAHPDGRSWQDPDKYKKKVPLVELDLAEEPNNSRLVYYGAQNCRDAGENEKAFLLYMRRASMGGWEEESWSALYEAAKLTELLGRSKEHIVDAYLSAFNARPTRAEPLWRLAKFFRERLEYPLAKLFAEQGILIPVPSDKLFVERDVYAWRLKNELACALWRLGENSRSKYVFSGIDYKDIPASEEAQMTINAAAIFNCHFVQGHQA
jgi:glycosyltransferase involved in cell wall biosynthesis